MNLINEVYDSLNWKRSDEWCADKLGLGIEKYRVIKQQILEVKNLTRDETDQMMKAIIQAKLTELSGPGTGTIISKTQEHLCDVIKQRKERVIEFKENIEAGTAEIKGIAFSEPRSPEEIIRVLKIDTNKWKLATYWNKEQKDYWLVSAMVAAKKSTDISIEDAEEIIKNVFVNNAFTPITSYPTITNKKALFVYISDRHVAAYVSDIAIYENKYDMMSYEARLGLVLHEMLYQAQLHGKFEDVFIIDLGDKMDGQHQMTTRGGHKLPQNMTDRQAFEVAVGVEKDWFDKVLTSDIANNYHVYQNANSNHGGDFDYMVNRALEIYLNARYPDVDTRIMQKFIEHLNYGVHTFLLTHGKDTEDMKHGLPLHMNDKTENYLRKYLEYHDINTKLKHVSVVKGDLHMATSQELYGFRYRNVLSLFGGSKWIGTNFGPNEPGCSFEVVDRDTSRIMEGKVPFTIHP